MKKSLLFLCLLLSLSACTKTVTVIEMPTLPEIPSAVTVPFKDPIGKTVTQPDTAPTWLDFSNHVTSVNVTQVVTQALTINQQYLVIDGLVNKSIEDKINKTLFDTSEELKKYADFTQAPLYSGIYKAYPQNKTRIDSINIGSSAYFTYANLLSVNTDVNIFTNKVDPEDYHWYDYQVSKHQTFDLNTGQEINLSDLFVSGCDYVARLNELIILDIQKNSNMEVQDMYYSPEYTYLGGFKGIRGDVSFQLSRDALVLIFDQNYPEFFNYYSPTWIWIPFSELQDILAFEQRFASEDALFTTPVTAMFTNYRKTVDNPTVILVEKRDQTLVQSIITKVGTLSERHKAISESILAADQKKIDTAVKNKTPEIRYEIKIYSVGPYMNIDRALYGGDGEVFLRVTYKPDGSLLTFSDVFRAGFDYKSLIITKMKEITTENQFVDVYDYEAIFQTMKVMITKHGGNGETYLRIFNKFQIPPDSQEGTFDMSLKLTDYPNDILIKEWAD